MTKNVFVALVGRPNVGKSSLLNCILGEKVAIVSNKPQTTRNRITGVLTHGDMQYVFIDTPGMHRPRSKLGDFMVKQAGGSIGDVDVVVLVADCQQGQLAIEKELAESISQQGVPAILAVNKIDTLERKDELLKRIAELSSLMAFEAVVPVSAMTNDGIDRLLREVDAFGSEGPHFFDDDAITDQPERVLVAEIIREKLLNNLRDEIPHGTAVVVDSMSERGDADIIDINATIICERENHKGMIIGRGGAMLKQIASQARVDCERFLGLKVNLKCWVKVREGWRDKDIYLQSYGYTDR